MRDLPIVVTWFLLLLVIVVAIWSGLLVEALQALGEGLAAIISGAFVLLAAILTHTLTELRDQRLSQEREMQRNYASVLGQIGGIIRNGGSSDDFSKIHLESWVWGSPQVIQATQELLRASGAPDAEPKRVALESLLRQMRRDAGLGEAPKELQLTDIFRAKGHI